MTSSQNQIAVVGGGLVPFVTQERRGTGSPLVEQQSDCLACMHASGTSSKHARATTHVLPSRQTADDVGGVSGLTLPSHPSIIISSARAADDDGARVTRSPRGD